MKKEIKNSITLMYKQCKKQYEDQQLIVDQLNYSDYNYQLENYVTGYLKGQVKIMERVLKLL
jgi:hypothetical protein